MEGRTGHTVKGFEGTVGRKLGEEILEETLRRRRVRTKALALGRLQSSYG